MPTLFELYGIPELGEAPPKVDTRPDLTRGLKTSFQQLPQLGYGVMAGVGAAAENLVGEGGFASGIKKAGVEGFQRWEDTIQQNSKESDSLSYSWDQAKQGNFGALVDWFQYGLGYAGGQALQMLATAGVGSLVGKATLGTVAKEAAKGMVLKEAAALKGTEAGATMAQDALIAQATKNVAGRIGETTAIGAAAVGMEGGEIFGDLVTDAEKQGRQLTGAELAKAFGATVAAGGLEFVGDKFGLDVMLGRSKLGKAAMGAAAEATGIGGRVARGALGAAITAPVEGGTEYLQTGLEEFGKGKEANILPFNQSEEAQKQAFDAAGLGAVGGAAFGGGAGILTRARAKQQQDDDAIVKITEAKTVDEAAAAAVAAVNTPLDVGLTVEQEARGLDSLDAQRQRDEASVKDLTNRPSDYLGPVPERPNRQPSITEGEPSPFLDRLLTLREQLDDPRTREQLREALGDEAFGTVAYYASIADRTGDDAPPFKTREKLLDLAETIVQRAVFQPIESRGLVGEPTRRAALGVAQGPPLLELDTTPTGRVRVDAQGIAAPETRADVIDLKQRVQQMRERSDGLTAQVDRRPLPRGFSLVGEGELTTPERRQPVERETLLLTRDPQPGDLLTGDSMPYGSMSAARMRARKEGGSVVAVTGGWVVRPEAKSAEVNATPLQPDADVVRVAKSDQSGNVLDAAAIEDKGLNLLDVPSQRVVLGRVIRSLEDPEIVRRVVERIPIDVVHMLFGAQGPSKSALHDSPVLQDALAARLQDSVPANVDVVADAIVRAVAGVTAELGPAHANALTTSLERATAVDARELPVRAEMSATADLGTEKAAGLRAVDLAGEAKDGRGAARTLNDRQVSTPTSIDELGPSVVATTGGPLTVRPSSTGGSVADVPLTTPLAQRVEGMRKPASPTMPEGFYSEPMPDGRVRLRSAKNTNSLGAFATEAEAVAEARAIIAGRGASTTPSSAQGGAAQPNSEQRPAQPEVESTNPRDRDSGDAGFAPGQESGAPSLKERVEATKPSREVIELRKREAVLTRLLECMSNG